MPEDIWEGAKTKDHLFAGLLTSLTNIAAMKAKNAEIQREEEREKKAREWEEEREKRVREWELTKLILEDQLKQKDISPTEKIADVKYRILTGEFLPEDISPAGKKILGISLPPLEKAEAGKLNILNVEAAARAAAKAAAKEEEKAAKAEAAAKKATGIRDAEIRKKTVLENEQMISGMTHLPLKQRIELQMLQAKYGKSAKFQRFENARRIALEMNKEKRIYQRDITIEDVLKQWDEQKIKAEKREKVPSKGKPELRPPAGWIPRK